MKSVRVALALTFLLAANAAMLAQTSTQTSPQTSAQKSFDQLKSLSGSWEGKNSKGQPLHVTFRDTAAGSALMSEIVGEGHDDMVSMFNLDGPNKLMITHYCGAGNQPRMTASTSADGKTISFDFMDATNLATPDAGHMQGVVFTIIDASHHTEDWTFAAAPGKHMKEFFDLHRAEVAKK